MINRYALVQLSVNCCPIVFALVKLKMILSRYTPLCDRLLPSSLALSTFVCVCAARRRRSRNSSVKLHRAEYSVVITQTTSYMHAVTSSEVACANLEIISLKSDCALNLKNYFRVLPQTWSVHKFSHVKVLFCRAKVHSAKLKTPWRRSTWFARTLHANHCP